MELEQADLRVQVALEVVRDETHLLSRPDVAELLAALGELDRQRGGRLGRHERDLPPRGRAPSLLAARPEMGRTTDTFSVRVIRRMSAMGVLVGTPESAGLPALMAATAPDTSSAFYSPPRPPRHGWSSRSAEPVAVAAQRGRRSSTVGRLPGADRGRGRRRGAPRLIHR